MRTIILLLAIIGMSSACTKQSCDELDGEGLVGKWVLKQTLTSPGPVGEWKHYWGPLTYFTFRDNGALESSDNLYDRYLVNGNYITFYKSSTADSSRLGYKVNGNELFLWGPCIEPCGSKYKRVQ